MQPRVVLLTGTFGQEAQNGVARFLSGLHKYSAARSYPLEVFSAGDHLVNYPGVHNIHALSFDIPGFQAVKFYYPLEGRRRQLRRIIKKHTPDLLHLSTPDPIGVTGLSVAKDLARPVAAIYHTDFPAFGRMLVQQALQRQVSQDKPFEVLLALGGPSLRRAQEEAVKHLNILERWVLKRALHRNRKRLARLLGRGSEWLASGVQVGLREVMFQFYSQCQLVIARSDVYKRELIEQIGLVAENVKTLDAGVDTRTFSPEKTQADDGLRQRLGIPEQARVVLYVGRVSDEKNIRFLADAWRRFQQHTRAPGSAVFVVVGSGQLTAFQERAGRYVLTLGARHGEELSALYRTADVFWTAATTETLGQVILEAQASGVPVLVSDQGASREHVSHAATGLVLPVDEPARWAEALRQLLEDEPRRKRLACDAWRSTARKTIERSYEHYWELHRELHQWEQERQKYAVCGRLSIRVAESLPPLRADTLKVRTTHVGDFHAGHGADPKHKARAVRIIAERARDRNAEVYLHGDFSDTRPKLNRLNEELEMFKRTFAEVGVSPRKYLEGNHDYEFARAGDLSRMVGCPVEPSLVAILDSGLVITHGHVSEIRELPDILRECKTVPEITEALSVDRLHERLKQSAFEYDLTGVLQDWLEKAGLDGLEDWWRHILPHRQRLVDTLLSVAHKRGIDTRAVDALIHMIGSKSREQVLARLCTALGGWGLVYGHTHDPHLVVINVPEAHGSGTRSVLLGNSGSMRRKRIPPTWIETQGKTMELYAYDKTKDGEVLVDRVSLDNP
jgi:glycosyltransferase involved in cell wall biosynthesis/UDP-2,3-diacylglucosamine pyrophosphatase LpxH